MAFTWVGKRDKARIERTWFVSLCGCLSRYERARHGGREATLSGFLIACVFYLLVTSLLAMATPVVAASTDSQVMLLYPEVSGVYQRIFAETIRGVESRLPEPPDRLLVSDDFDRVELERWVGQSSRPLLMSLGRSGWQATTAVDATIPRVIGAVFDPPESPFTNQATISLAPAPQLLFAKLRELVPTVERVYLVHSPHYKTWLVDRAQVAAQQMGVELVLLEAQDIRQSARQFRQLLKQMRSQTDALWLLQDQRIVNDQVVLPHLLKTAWKRNLIIVSSGVGHVSRGALLALYPDHYQMGQRLGDLAQQLRERETGKDLLPLLDVRTAVNIRTAKHLGLKFSSTQRRSFDLVFPKR